MSHVIKPITHCRICKKSSLVQIWSFGPTPLANAFLTQKELDTTEQFFPLDVYFCTTCTLVQLGHVVSPELLFKDYVYVSSTSSVFIEHFREFSRGVVNRFGLNIDSLIVDIGSNDGILLKPFKQAGFSVLGVEPAEKIARLAQNSGIDTLIAFFSKGVAKKILKAKGPARILTATNVFAHIDDLDEMISGVDTLLSADGIFIFEVPHLVDFIKKNLFDTIYHEHLSYCALTPLMRLFQRFDMEVFDVEKVPTHGGSLRVYVKRNQAAYKKTSNMKKIQVEERSLGLHEVSVYKLFYDRIRKNKAQLVSLLGKLKSRGKTIAGYGAPAKGNTLLNFFGIGRDFLDFIAEDSILKQGLFSPGKRIPVVSPQEIYLRQPDYLLILAWNFATVIMQTHQKYREKHGKFIIPVPQSKII